MNRNSDGKPLTNPILTLTTAPQNLQTRVVRYAYPRYANIVAAGQQTLNLLPDTTMARSQNLYQMVAIECFSPGHATGQALLFTTARAAARYSVRQALLLP